MKKLKHFGIYLAVIIASLGLTATARFTSFQAFWSLQLFLMPTQVPSEVAPISWFILENKILSNFIIALPLICMLLSFVFLIRKKTKLAFAMTAFPALFILPLFTGTNYEAGFLEKKYIENTNKEQSQWDSAVEKLNKHREEYKEKQKEKEILEQKEITP